MIFILLIVLMYSLYTLYTTNTVPVYLTHMKCTTSNTPDTKSVSMTMIFPHLVWHTTPCPNDSVRQATQLPSLTSLYWLSAKLLLQAKAFLV